MGIQDFGAVFDILDPACRGYLTATQVQQFHETLHFTPIIRPHVDAAIQQICGPEAGDRVTRQFFVEVLQELNRRKAVEERARWDFMSLDKYGTNRISLADALMLFKLTHGSGFSLVTWKKFLASRELPDFQVSFDEMRMWLCSPPEGTPCSEQELADEKRRLLVEENNKDEQQFNEYLHFQSELTHQAAEAKRREEYREKTQRMARRKLHMWEKEGVEALVYDDGIDRGEVIPDRVKVKLSINDVLDALDYKYSTLRKKLFWHMIKKNMGSALFSSMGDHEQYETYHQLQVQEQQMRDEGILAENVNQLYGATVPHDAPLPGIMGYLPQFWAEKKAELNDRRAKLRKENKSEDAIEKILRQDFEKEYKVSCSSGQMLVLLHERHLAEKQLVIKELQEGGGSGIMLHLLGRLQKQNIMLDQEEGFTTSALAVGLAERQQEYRAPSFEPDRLRQESLATDRLADRKGRKLALTDASPATPVPKDANMGDLQLALIMEVAKRHAHEREMMVHLLQDSESKRAKAAASRMNVERKSQKMTSLRNQRNSWRENNTEYRASHKQVHLDLLQEGAGIYYNDRCHSLGTTNEDTVNASILADLQQRQDQEMYQLMQGLQGKEEKDFVIILHREQKTRQAELLDNVAFILLGAFQCSDEEKLYMEALERKYEALRLALYTHELKLEHGGTWDRLSDEEQERQIKKLAAQEKKLRQDGKLEQMSSLISRAAKELGNLRSLLGEDRAEYDRRMKRQKDVIMESEMRGQKVTSTPYDDEDPNSSVKHVNLLGDLTGRFFLERDAVIGQLRAGDSSAGSQVVLLVRLKMEAVRAEREVMFDTAAYSVGAAERVEGALTRRHKADRARQEKLANQRAGARKKRLALEQVYVKEFDERAPPPAGALLDWQEAYMYEMHKKHRDEWEIYLRVVQDAGMDELREAAATLSEDEMQTRLAELYGKYQRLELDDPGQQEENSNIMEEAAAIRLVQKQRMLAQHQPEASWEDTIAGLQMELQDTQDREYAEALDKLPIMDEEEVKNCREEQIMSRKQEAAENVVRVLTRYEGIGEDDELLKALDEKYDALRDKLLLEALMNQMGKKDWKKLSEEERQRKLAELKLKERQLRKEGKWDELAQLLGEGAQHEEALQRLMGDNRADYNRKLQEQLERRRQRIQQGLDPDDSDSGIDETDADDEEKKSIFAALQGRYEEDKEALLARLRGMDNEYLTEKERQAELVRLRRERRKAQEEEKFDNAAKVIGLAERQRAQAEQRLKNDRQRQEQLAKERLAKLRSKKEEKKRKKGGKKVDEEVVREGGKDVLQDAIMKRLDETHEQEREILVRLLNKCGESSVEQKRLHARAMSRLERRDKLEELRDKRQSIYPDQITEKMLQEPGPAAAAKDEDDECDEKVVDNMAVLEDACVVRLEDRKEVMVEERENTGVADDEVAVTLMADLQEQQDTEAEKYINMLPGKDDQELIELQVKLMYNQKYERAENVALILFGMESCQAGQKELLEALDSKYDALRDKLLTEALMQQVGEREWQKLSEQERQRRLIELKLKEKQLRREGRIEEAAELLGTAFNEHQALDSMLGLTKEEQERRLQERLAKRKERLAAGMTEEECNKLEEQDEEDAEIQRRKQRRNVLMDLQHHYDKEREALLQGMRDSDNHLLSEQERQRQLAQLRREQRRAKQEDKFDAAAIALGLARQGETAKEVERRRQEDLARQRLEARRNRKNQQSLVKEGEIALPDDPNDLGGLQEALLQEVERKQLAEREAFLTILQDAQQSSSRTTAKSEDAVQRRNRLEGIRQLRRARRGDGTQEIPEKEHLGMLKDAAGICYEDRHEFLRNHGKDSTDDDIQVSLCAHLQQQQDEEMRQTVESLQSKDGDSLRQMKYLHNMSFQQKWYNNIAHVLLGGGGEAQADPSLSDAERQLVEQLEQKYDALRDKLLMEALMKQVGEKEWSKLSEQEQQARLVKLKLEEKRLREEGKYEEAATLLGQLADQQEELQRRLGDTEEDQKRRLEARLRRKEELLAGRTAQGLPTDDATIDAILDKEEAEQEKHKRKNILENLNQHFEEEKARLLALLRSQNDAAAAEQQRQLELARLKREQRRLNKEDKFDAAALLISVSAQRDKNRLESLAAERERQKQLARDRLAAKKRAVASRKGAKLHTGEVTADQLKQEEEERARQELLSSAAQGPQTVQDKILAETERRQEREREMLLELIAAAEADKETLKAAKDLNSHDLKHQLVKLQEDRTKWKKKSRQAAFKMADKGAKATTAEKEEYQAAVAQSQNEQFKLLTKAMVYRLQVEKEQMQAEHPRLPGNQVMDEITVTLLADLQVKQEAENATVTQVMAQQDAEGLQKVREAQEMASRECWVDNLANTIFTKTGDHTEVDLSEGLEMLRQEMQDTFDKEQDDLILKLERRKAQGEPVDVEAALFELQRQQDARRQALNDNREKQREMLQAKLEARRYAHEKQEYEQDTARELLRMMERQQTFINEKTSQERGRQGNLLQEKLAARRKARQQEPEGVLREGSMDSEEGTMPRPPSMDSLPSSAEGMRRERTMVDVNLSESEQQRMMKQLMRDQRAAASRISADQSRQMEELQRRLQAKKDKRESEAMTLMTRGHHHKAKLERGQQDERERQLAAQKERVARVRYERTQTMKERASKETKKFDEMLQKDASGDEKMEKLAQEMQQKFKQDEADVREGRKKTNITEEEGAPSGESEEKQAEAARPGKILNEEERLAKIRARREAKRKQKELEKLKAAERQQLEEPGTSEA